MPAYRAPRFGVRSGRDGTRRVPHQYPYLERVLGEQRRGLWVWSNKLGDWALH